MFTYKFFIHSPERLTTMFNDKLHGKLFLLQLLNFVLDQEDLCSASITSLGEKAVNHPDLHWRQKLESAQNVLFCKELFNQLAKEAVQLHAPIPHMVLGNQIMASVSI